MLRVDCSRTSAVARIDATCCTASALSRMRARARLPAPGRRGDDARRGLYAWLGRRVAGDVHFGLIGSGHRLTMTRLTEPGSRPTAGGGAGDRLRGAGARDPGAEGLNGWSISTCSACRRSCTSGRTASPTPSRRRCRGPAALRADLRRLRRLRHRRLLAARCAALGVEMIAGPHCYSFFDGNAAFAARGDAEMTRLLPDRLPGAPVRRLRLAADGPRPPPGAARHDLRQLRAAGSTWRRPTTRRSTPRPARCAARLGLAFERRFTGYGDLATALGAIRWRSSLARGNVPRPLVSTTWP